MPRATTRPTPDDRVGDSAPFDVVAELRRTRRRRRLGATEWFEVAYRAYLVAFFGGSAAIVVSERVGDQPLAADQISRLLADGPRWAGVLAAILVAGGLRSGANGGPLAIEPADAHVLLLAPVDRRRVLTRPYWQHVRATVLGSAATGAMVGLLAEQRLASNAAAWAGWGAVAGAALALAAIAAAAISHAARMPRWSATLAGSALIAVQATTAASSTTGPLDAVGAIGFGADRNDVPAVVAVAALVLAALWASLLIGRLRPEAIVRRGALVAQLRFAVTMQDLRTAVLLRRQLRQELPRHTPWIAAPAGGGRSPSAAAIWRSVHGIARTPLSRLGRMAALIATAGAACGVAIRGTTPALAIAAVALFVLGLDALEPLSQEVDHPERTAGLSVANGWLHIRLLVAPFLLVAALAPLGAAACAVVAPGSIVAAAVLAIPVAWCGMVGGVVNAIRDEFDPHREAAKPYEAVVPPEVAGLGEVFRIGWPIVLSAVGTLAVLAVRQQPEPSMVARSSLGLVLWLAGAGWWLARRSQLRAWWRGFRSGS